MSFLVNPSFLFYLYCISIDVMLFLLLGGGIGGNFRFILLDSKQLIISEFIHNLFQIQILFLFLRCGYRCFFALPNLFAKRKILHLFYLLKSRLTKSARLIPRIYSFISATEYCKHHLQS